MPKTKLAVAFAKPDYTWFEKIIKKRMIELDTWYQGVDKKMGRNEASIRSWVKNPETFRFGDLLGLLEALEFSPEEQDDILARLRRERNKDLEVRRNAG